jgi:hypothetical protein
MRTQIRKTTQLGELVAAVFDEAAHHSTDPREVSRLAARAVMHMIRHARKTSHIPRRLASRHGGSS